ncbi:MAG: hypothetical protein H7240_06125 [Glaciimonas sp.]|nr:hypothetical protein [Glaciimonas sp.]
MSTLSNIQRTYSMLSKPHFVDAGTSKKHVNLLGTRNCTANTLMHAAHEGITKLVQAGQFIDQLAQQPKDQKPILL